MSSAGNVIAIDSHIGPIRSNLRNSSPFSYLNQKTLGRIALASLCNIWVYRYPTGWQAECLVCKTEMELPDPYWFDHLTILPSTVEEFCRQHRHVEDVR